MADMDMSPPRPDEAYWTAALWGDFLVRLIKLAKSGDKIAQHYLEDFYAGVERRDIVSWITEHESVNIFSWRLLKGHMGWASFREPSSDSQSSE